MADKRKQIESLIYKVMDALDKSGTNTKKYKSMFQVMSDDEFKQWIDAFLKDKKSNFRLDIEEFGPTNRKLMYEDVEDGAKVLGINLFEYVYMPHLSENKNHPVRTKHPVMVGWLNVKRPQQLASKKTGLTLTDTQRDEMSGSAKGKSKGGTTSGIENELLAGVGADVVLSEISGSRGDNVQEYTNMMGMISESGSVKLNDIKTNVYDKPTLLKADLLFNAMGLKTDLISESYYSIANVKKAMKK